MRNREHPHHITATLFLPVISASAPARCGITQGAPVQNLWWVLTLDAMPIAASNIHLLVFTNFKLLSQRAPSINVHSSTGCRATHCLIPQSV